MGRYVSQPLSIQCKTMEEVRNFLLRCRAVSDEELFGKRDYWQPPDQFEKLKAGDCEDFSFWTWRQLLAMGFDARVVFGKHGRYGIGHAWVEFFHDGKCYLLEPQARVVGLTLPRLSVLRYKPMFSVAWDGKILRYYAHKSHTRAGLMLVLTLLPEMDRYLGIVLAQGCASSSLSDLQEALAEAQREEARTRERRRIILPSCPSCASSCCYRSWSGSAD